MPTRVISFVCHTCGIHGYHVYSPCIALVYHLYITCISLVYHLYINRVDRPPQDSDQSLCLVGGSHMTKHSGAREGVKSVQTGLVYNYGVYNMCTSPNLYKLVYNVYTLGSC